MFGRKYHTRESELISDNNTIVKATAATTKIAKATVATKDMMAEMANDDVNIMLISEIMSSIS